MAAQGGQHLSFGSRPKERGENDLAPSPKGRNALLGRGKHRTRDGVTIANREAPGRSGGGHHHLARARARGHGLARTARRRRWTPLRVRSAIGVVVDNLLEERTDRIMKSADMNIATWEQGRAHANANESAQERGMLYQQTRLSAPKRFEHVRLADIHASIVPADVREGENIVALIPSPRDSNSVSEYRVWGISPLGADLWLRDNPARLASGEHVDVAIRIGGQLCEFAGLMLSHPRVEGSKRLISLRWCSEDVPRDHSNRRSQKRWQSGPAFPPTIVSSNPCRLNDSMYFKVMDVSSKGMRLQTSLRNKHLVPNLKLDCKLSIPGDGDVRSRFTIRWTKIDTDAGREVLSLGARFDGPDKALVSSIGQYVFQFGPPASMAEIRQSGLWLKSAAAGVEFTHVRTEQEYKQVLELRRLSYSQAGKMSVDATLEKLADEFDARARILIAKHRGNVVASLRIIFHGPEDRLEEERFVALPPGFPRNEELLEVMRVCTHPDYRKSEILYRLFQQLMVVALQVRRRWIVGSATRELLPLYLRLGCKRTGLIYRHEDLGDLEHELFLLNVPGVIKGEGVSPIVWNIVGEEICRHALLHDLLELDTWSKIRLFHFKFWKPLADAMLKIRKRSARRGRR